jgi:hypothetical protein
MFKAGTVSEETLREILVNAYSHRCWRTHPS